MSRGGHSVVTTGVTGPAPPQAYNEAMKTRRLTRYAQALAVAGLTAILIAACGGGAKKPPASSSGASASNSSAIRSAYRYADCMRSHGVSAFQDPHVQINGNSSSVAFHVDPQMTSSPAWKSAQSACAHILPGQVGAPTPAQIHARVTALVAFASCIRRHGFPKFPDPNSQGRLNAAMLSAAGINLQQPAIKPAADACVGLTHGIITKADINQAISNPSRSGSHTGSGG